MKAWVATKVEGGFTVDCFDGKTGLVCAQVGCIINAGGCKASVWSESEAAEIVVKRNAFELEKLNQEHREHVEQMTYLEQMEHEALITEVDDSDDSDDHDFD